MQSNLSHTFPFHTISCLVRSFYCGPTLIPIWNNAPFFWATQLLPGLHNKIFWQRLLSKAKVAIAVGNRRSGEWPINSFITLPLFLPLWRRYSHCAACFRCSDMLLFLIAGKDGREEAKAINGARKAWNFSAGNRDPKRKQADIAKELELCYRRLVQWLERGKQSRQKL